MSGILQFSHSPMGYFQIFALIDQTALKYPCAGNCMTISF